jgi:hypothetical protein
VVIGRKDLSKYNILQENDHASTPGKLLIMHKKTNMPGRNSIFLFPKKYYPGMKNYAQFNIIIGDFIRIVIFFFKYNTFYFTYPPRKHDFNHILPSCLLFIAKSRKYHSVVVLLHNDKWLKKVFNLVS